MNTQRIRSVALGALGGLLLAACNVTLTLNTENLESNITTELQRQNQGLTVNSVTCPERPLQINDTFTCTASTSSGDVTVRATQTDDQGHVSWVVE